MKSKLLLASVLLLALSGAASSAAPAADTGQIAGIWRGTVRTAQSRPLPIKLEIKPAQLGEQAATLTWGAPYACSNKLEYADEEKGTYYLTLAAGDGPYCDSIRDGQADLALVSPTELNFVLHGPKSNSVLHDTKLVRDIPRP